MNQTGSIAGLSSAKMNEKKNIYVGEALNGFVINLGYGNETHIATSVEQALAIIGEYLTRPKATPEV